jgi:hypothetical protein
LGRTLDGDDDCVSVAIDVADRAGVGDDLHVAPVIAGRAILALADRGHQVVADAVLEFLCAGTDVDDGQTGKVVVAECAVRRGCG